MVFLSDSSQEQLEFVTTNAVPDVSGCVSTEDCVLECVLLTNDALLVVGDGDTLVLAIVPLSLSGILFKDNDSACTFGGV